MKKFLPGERKSTPGSVAMNVNGEICNDNLEIVNGFNNYFASAVSHLTQ